MAIDFKSVMRSKFFGGGLIAIVVLAVLYIYLTRPSLRYVPVNQNKESEPAATEPGVQPVSEAKAIVIVYSYEVDFWVSIAEDKGVMAAFAEGHFIEGKNLTVKRIYMDTKTVNRSPRRMVEITPGIVAQIKQMKPDLVLLFDDNATKFIGAELLHSKLSVVFGSVNGNPTDADYTRGGALAVSIAKPTYNITGILERMPVLSGFEILRDINPKARTVALISDNSNTSRAIVKTIGGVSALDRAALAVKSRLFTNDFEQFKAFVLSQQGKVDALAILVVYTMRDANGNPVLQQQVVRWLLENSRIPGICYSEIIAAEGFLLTVAVDLEKQGYYAGLMGMRILRGAKPADIPILDPVAKKIMINLARAEQLGVDIPMSLLKRASHVYKEMSLYPEYGRRGKQ